MSAPRTCPNCGQLIREASREYKTVRPGGRQVSYQRGVRVLAGYLADQGFMDEARAERVAARVLTLALPTKQRHPRKLAASDLREAA